MLVAKVVKDTVLVVRVKAYPNVVLQRNSISITSLCFYRPSAGHEILQVITAANYILLETLGLFISKAVLSWRNLKWGCHTKLPGIQNASDMTYRALAN